MGKDISFRNNCISDLIKRYPVLKSIKDEILNAYLLLEECYRRGNKVLVAGNGGSAADAEHFMGELMKRFKIPRPVTEEFAEKLKSVSPDYGETLSKNLECALPTISLVSHSALSTAYINDVDGIGVFAQQMFGFGKVGDVFLAISTSGNSENVINAAVVAKALGIKVIALTGRNGGKLNEFSDVSVCVPEKETYLIQELHLPIYHCWCMILESVFFAD